MKKKGFAMQIIDNRIYPLLLQRGDRLQSSESDVYRRQVLTTEVDPRTVKIFLMAVTP